MLTQHEFYVYYAENRVYARWGKQAPVLAQTLATPQAAHDFVQKIVNPMRFRKEDFDSVPMPVSLQIPDGATEAQITEAALAAVAARAATDGVNVLGFLHPAFQGAISPNCEAFVRGAYAKAQEAAAKAVEGV